jgi:hypothetical protein
MTGYLALPAAWRASPDVAASWVERTLAHVRSMPPKIKKPQAKDPGQRRQRTAQRARHLDRAPATARTTRRLHHPRGGSAANSAPRPWNRFLARSRPARR